MDITLKNYSFKINPGENLQHWHLINTMNWEPKTFSIYDFFITKNSKVLDLGAWSGVLTLYAAKIACKVYAVDPDPICFKELEQNVKLNTDITNKIKLFDVGISNKKETVNLFARKTYGASSSSILQRQRDKKTSLKINTVSLLEFLNTYKIDNIDFIKMDIEGAEFKVLPTIKESLIKLNYPTLFISFHYSFLNEHIYFKKIPYLFITKVLMKTEQWCNFSIFKKTIKHKISNLFDDLKDYKYIYMSDGSEITYSFLINNPLLIKQNNLVFSNIKWDIKQ